jgi:DNA-binding response OmpR family regulator
LQQATILLIDDNAIQAATRQAILRRAGYFVIAGLNPQRTMEQFREEALSENVQMVVTDHIMPAMNGCEFVRQLRKYAPTLPVLVISGLEEAECEYEGLDVYFRVKPLPPGELLALVARVLGTAPHTGPDLPRTSPETP